MEKVDLLIGEETPLPPGAERGFIIGEYFGYWSELDISLRIDGFSSVGFRAPYESSRKEFREAFRPFTFKPCEVQIKLETIFKGTLLDVEPDFSADEKSVKVTAFSKPEVFSQCDMPVSVLKDGKGLEFKKLGLRAIVAQLLAPFEVLVDFQADEGTPFDKVKIDTDQKVFDFIVDLAKQRNIIVSNTADGKMLFWQSTKPGQPVVEFVQGRSPLSKITPTFNPRECYSEITGFSAKKRGKSPSRDTQKNPWLTKPLRPQTLKLEDTERGDAPEATRARMGRMFGAMVSWKIENIPTWRDPNGKLWQPNTYVSVYAPDAMIYTKTDLLIRGVDLHQDANNESASLEVVLPGVFSGEVPTSLPWNEP